MQPIKLATKFEYSETTALSSLDKNGNKIEQGPKTTFIQFGTDPRFYIPVQILKMNKWWDQLSDRLMSKENYVEITQGGEKLLIDIQNLSKRLHLSIKSIRKAEKEGTFRSLIEQQTQKISTVLDSYDKIVKSMKFKSPSQFNPKTLMKVIKIALKADTFTFFPVKMADELFHIGFDKEKRQIQLVKMGSSIGKGTFAEIRSWTDLFSEQLDVLKKVRHDSHTSVLKGKFQSEFDLVSEIHSQGKVWGVQSKPKKVIHIHQDIGRVSRDQFGFITEKYEGNYLEMIRKEKERPLESLLTDIHQILTGLKQLHEKNILHRDLKPENLLYKRDAEGWILIHIADFGGAKKVTKDISLEQLSGTKEFSPKYSLKKDLQLSSAGVELGLRDDLIELEKARDIFAMGCIIHFALTQKLPFNKFEETVEFPIPDSYERMTRSDIPSELIDYFEATLNSDYRLRPSAEDLLDTFNGYLAVNHQELFEKIQDKIDAEYSGTTPESTEDYAEIS